MDVTQTYRNRTGFCYSEKLSLTYLSFMDFGLSLQYFIKCLLCARAFPGATAAKEPTYQCMRREFDPWVWGDPLEREMATCSSVLAWEITWTEEPGGLRSMRAQTCQPQLSS